MHAGLCTYEQRIRNLVCVHMCVASHSAWLFECNGTALMDAHLSWSVQSVAEVQPSRASSPAWKPYNLLSTILTLFSRPLHFPHFSLPVFLSLSQFNIFIPSSLTEPACLHTVFPLNLFILGLDMKRRGLSLWLAVDFPFFSSLLLCSEKNEIREDDM